MLSGDSGAPAAGCSRSDEATGWETNLSISDLWLIIFLQPSPKLVIHHVAILRTFSRNRRSWRSRPFKKLPLSRRFQRLGCKLKKHISLRIHWEKISISHDCGCLPDGSVVNFAFSLISLGEHDACLEVQVVNKVVEAWAFGGTACRICTVSYPLYTNLQTQTK